MKQARLSETLPVRIDIEVEKQLMAIALATRLSKSAVMRLAIAHGLPMLEAGRIVVSPAKVKSA